MRPFLVALALLAVGFAAPARAGDDLQALLSQRLDGYYAAMRSGDIDKALSFYSAAQRADIQNQMASEGTSREDTAKMMQAMAPQSFTVQRLAPGADADHVSLFTIGMAPDESGTPQRAEMQIDFVQEQGNWMIETVIYGMNPDTIKRAANDDPEPDSAYDNSSSLNIGGPIVRVAFEPDHTLIVIRVLDEEHDLFLPPKDKLKAMGVDPDQLKEGVIVSGDGATSQNDEFKHRIDTLEIQNP